MDKKIKVLIIYLVILIIGVIGYFIFSSLFSDSARFKREYEKFNGNYVTVNIDKDNNVQYVNVDEALDILESGTGILYIGEPKCNKCRAVLPTLLEMAKEEEVENVYYLNVSDIRDVKKKDEDGNVVTTKKGSDEYYKLMDALNKYLPDYKGIDDGSKRIYFPSFVFIMGGKVVGFYTNDIYDKALSFKEKDVLKNIYKDSIDEMYGTCDESC